MSDLKLFRLNLQTAVEVHGSSMGLEKSLQSLIEQNLECFLGVRFLASEFSTGRDHGGRMDTLGIDENHCPVIIEYKRNSNSNVINQGLFYLDWLVTHRGNFEMLVLKVLGQEAAKSVEWSAPRLICIAGDFSRYDEHAIKQMNHNIDLIRYMKFDDDLLLFEQVNVASVPAPNSANGTSNSTTEQKIKITTVSQSLEKADAKLTRLFETVREYLESLGDDVQFKPLRFYFAFKRIKNFACVEVKTQNKYLTVHVKIDPDSITLEDGFTRDVRTIGHFGTGDLEIIIRTMEDLERAKPLFEQSYENA